MISREQSISNFTRCVNELIASNYILADKKISTLLKCVSSSKIFMELFEFCTQGFDYNLVKSRSFISGKQGERGKFVLPTNPQSIIALVFLFLCEIDTKRVSFFPTLDYYFYEDGNYKESYARFASQVLLPFKNEVLHVIEQMIAGEKTLDSSKVVVKKVEKPVLDENQSEIIKNLLNQSKAIILQYKMSQQLKAELLALYENFLSSLYGTSADKIKLAFLGYKYSTLYHRKLDVSVGEIEIILKRCGILDEFNWKNY